MPATSTRVFRFKRILFIAGGLAAFLLLFVLAVRITVMEIFNGIERSKSAGLAALVPAYDGNIWLQRGESTFDPSTSRGQSWVSRSAELRMRSSSFDRSVAALHEMVSAHNGYFEDLRTESHSGSGRALAAMLAVPSRDFDAALSDLKTLGRTQAVSQAGEDSAIKVESAARRVDATKTNLSRLQKLQGERRGELRDAVALEKDIAQASEAVAEAGRQHEALLSTVALARIHVSITEDYRAALEANLAGTFLALRNSFVDGVGAVFSSVSLLLGVLLEYGLPLLFWLAPLFWPARTIWRRFRAKASPLAATV